MFPAIDPALVRSLYAEAPTSEFVVESLLALSAELATPHLVETPSVAMLSPPRNLGVEDHEKFPGLVNSGGSQVLSQRQLEQNWEDLGSAWCDRARAAKDITAPQAAPSARALEAAAGVNQASRRQSRTTVSGPQPLMTDYELRQRDGQLRAQRRARCGRSGRGVAARPGPHRREESHATVVHSNSSESEAEDSILFASFGPNGGVSRGGNGAPA